MHPIWLLQELPVLDLCRGSEWCGPSTQREVGSSQGFVVRHCLWQGSLRRGLRWSFTCLFSCCIFVCIFVHKTSLCRGNMKCQVCFVFFFTSGKDSNVLIELPTSLPVAKRKAASICQPKSPHWHGHRHRPPGARRIAVWNSRSKQGEQTVDVLVFFPSGTNGWWMSSRVFFFFFFRILRCLWFEGIFLKNKIWIGWVMPIGRFERTQSNLGKWPVFGDGGYRIRCQHVRRIPRSSTWTAKLRSHPLLHLGADNQPVKLMGKHGKSSGHSATPVERKTV